MADNKVSAVIFAKDLQKMASFYREVFGARVSRSDAHHELLELAGFHLVVHQIPHELAKSIVISSPPERLESNAVRLNFPVADIVRARRNAQRLGGQIDDRPPAWATDESLFLGFDPEGNVIGVTPAKE